LQFNNQYDTGHPNSVLETNMVKVALWTTTAILCASTALLAPSLANADTDAVLQGVAFADGATASGDFSLNQYGYLDTVGIATTSSATFSSNTYTTGQTTGPTQDSLFYFSGSSDYSLALDFATAVSFGSDALVAGSDSGSTLSGSYEYCTEPSVCGSGTYRLITDGSVYVTEPATLGVLALGVTALAATRRRGLPNRGAA
jgi:hypothetical protein